MDIGFQNVTVSFGFNFFVVFFLKLLTPVAYDNSVDPAQQFLIHMADVLSESLLMKTASTILDRGQTENLAQQGVIIGVMFEPIIVAVQIPFE